VPEVRVSFEPSDIVSRVMSFGSRTPIEIAVSGSDLAASREFAQGLRAQLVRVASLRDVQVGQPDDYPTVHVAVDRARAGLLGVSTDGVAKAEVAKIETLLEYTRVTAPFDGVVTRRLINRGALVQAATSTRGLPLFTVQRTDLMRVFADVPEAEAPTVSAGAPAEIIPYGQKGPGFPGRVTRTAGSLDPATRTLRVETDLANAEGRLLHGMYVRVRIRPGTGPLASQPAEDRP
jgi:RND family efflux transporter MFP subunit